MDERHPFDKISDILDTSYKDSEEKPSKDLQVFSNDTSKDVIEDTDYIKFELKSLIENGVNMLEKLSEDIKIGTSVRSHEVYFKGLESVKSLVKELKELNLDNKKLAKEDAKVVSNGASNQTQINNFFTSKDLLKMINKADKESTMKDIDMGNIEPKSNQEGTK